MQALPASGASIRALRADGAAQARACMNESTHHARPKPASDEGAA
jgi:hypothetical protein